MSVTISENRVAEDLLSLKSSVFFSAVDGGAVFRGNGAPLIIRGARAHDLAMMVAERMQPGRSRDDLLASLPEGVRPAANSLLSGLDERDLLRKRDPQDATPEIDLDPRFSNLWNFLADNHRLPGATLESWRRATFYVEGTAPACLYVARALAECAARHIVIASSMHEEGGEPRYRDAIEELKSAFGDLRVDVAGEAHSAADFPGAVKIYAGGDRPFRAELSTLRDAWYFGLLARHLAICYIEGALGKALPEYERRLRPALEGDDDAQLPEMRIAVAANAVAFGVLATFCGIRAPIDVRELHVVGADCRLTKVNLPAPQRIRMQEAKSVEAVPPGVQTDTQRLDALQPLFDPYSGILEPVDTDVPQVPLSIAQVRVNGSKTIVSGWGLTEAEARLRAIRDAVRLRVISEPRVRSAAGLAIDWSADRAREAAAACAALAEIREADWRELDVRAVTNPDTRKVAKLMALQQGEEPELVYVERANGAAVAVEVRLRGRALARARASDLHTAVYEALGSACLALQLAGHDEQGAESPAAHRDSGSNADLRFGTIELGYAGVDEIIHCCFAEPASH